MTEAVRENRRVIFHGAHRTDAEHSSAPQPEAPLTQLEMDECGKLLARVRESLNGALRGKPEVIERVMACLLARGHLLVEDLPGLGKTTLAKALAGVIGGEFSRIQCTPDLLPGDITGFNVFNQQSRAFEFRPGPVFADILLADEINRATPRTQSALLEVMAERQVTVDNVTYSLPDRFFVIATQNPVELHGTFPLPEAQLDRFAMKLRIGYPEKQHVAELLAQSIGRQTDAPLDCEQVVSHEELLNLQHTTAHMSASEAVQQYVVELGEAARNHRRVALGISPRALLIWLRLAQSWALLQQRDFVTPDDVQAVALPLLEVRLSLDEAATADIVEDILGSVDVPVYPQP